MSVVMSMHWREATPQQYEQTCEAVDWDQLPSAGAILHLSSFGDDGMHVLDVWESAEHFQRFLETTLRPSIARVGIEGEPEVSIRPLHTLWSATPELAAMAT